MKPTVWRDAIRDSGLDATAKAVAWTLSTYMNGRGEAWPAKETIAQGASKSKRAVDGAIVRIVQAGYLAVSQSRGRLSNRYQATTPTMQLPAGLTVQTPAPLKDANPADSSLQPCRNEHPTLQLPAPESVEGALAPSALTKATRARERAAPAGGSTGGSAAGEMSCPVCGPLRSHPPVRLDEHLVNVHGWDPDRAISHALDVDAPELYERLREMDADRFFEGKP